MMKYVTKEEFAQFLLDYPRQLTTSITGICEPMARLYHDGDKMVGTVHLFENYPKGEGPYTWGPNTFKLVDLS
jgi:hypothetical protein